jgi:hypothetical protein
MNARRSLFVIIFATQLGGGVASAEMHPGRIELGHDSIVKAGFLTKLGEAGELRAASKLGHLGEDGVRPRARHPLPDVDPTEPDRVAGVDDPREKNWMKNRSPCSQSHLGELDDDQNQCNER